MISVLGHLDASTVPDLETQVSELSSEGGGALVLDLSRTRSLSDAGFDAVVDLMRTPHPSPRRLLLVIGHGSTARALAATAAAHGFPTYATLVAADAARATTVPSVGATRVGAEFAGEFDDAGEDGLGPAWQDVDELLVLTDDPRPALHLLARLTCSCLEAADGASIIVGSPVEPDLFTASSSWTQHLDGLQFTAAEGPALDAFRSRRPVFSPSLPQDQHWPALRGLLASRDSHRDGMPRGCAAVPLRLRPRECPDEVLGVLTVYSRIPDRLGSPPAQRLLRRLASRSAGIVTTAQRIREVVTTQDQLQRALTSRAVIDQAKGMIMSEKGCSADEAFAFLRRASNRTQRKLSEIAHEMVQIHG